MARKKRGELVLELAPFIDVTFLLIIFFLVTSVFKKDELALILNLPKVTKADQDSSKNDESLNLEVTAAEIAVNGKVIEFSNLPDYLKNLKKKTFVNLRVDQGVQYQRVISIIEVLQKNEFHNLNLVTKENQP
jgi:biopolymer transport protein ExbD